MGRKEQVDKSRELRQRQKWLVNFSAQVMFSAFQGLETTKSFDLFFDSMKLIDSNLTLINLSTGCVPSLRLHSEGQQGNAGLQQIEEHR